VINAGGRFSSQRREPVIVHITNGRISFKANGKKYDLIVPDSKIQFAPNASTASSSFVNNSWETIVPVYFEGDIFMAGLAYRVTEDIPGNVKDVKWTANVSFSRDDVSFTWKWAAAVYTTFADHAGIQVKPVDGKKILLFSNNDRAGTPQNFKQHVIRGAKGKGYPDFTGDYSKKEKFNCKGKGGHNDDDDDDDDDDQMLLQLTPNPSIAYFNLTINNRTPKASTVTVLNLFGQVVEKHEKVYSNTVIKIGEKLNTGIYLAVITQGDQQKTIKIIKVK
jgi:hypothetical protein